MTPPTPEANITYFYRITDDEEGIVLRMIRVDPHNLFPAKDDYDLTFDEMLSLMHSNPEILIARNVEEL